MKSIVLITGGLGYMGGRIAQKLSDDPRYILRLGTHRPVSEKPEWINKADIVRMDLLSGKGLENACKGVRYIIHLAAINEIESSADPERALMINGLGTLKVLRAAQKAGVERFIYFSTARVYGFPLVGTITEDTLPRPVHPYAITHKTAEDFVLAAHDCNALAGIILRVSNTIGAPAHPHVDRWMLVFNDLCRQAVTQRKLILKSSGVQNRDFITLTDVSRAASHILTMSVSKFDNCIFNLGGENSITIMEMAEIIAARCGEVLGYIPPIIRPEAQDNEVLMKIEYHIDKLKSTGFSLLSNRNEEIDATLRLCERYFKDK